MIASTFARRLGVCAPLAALALLISAGTSFGDAKPCDPSAHPCTTTIQIRDSYELSGPVEIECSPYAGTISGQATDTGGFTFQNSSTPFFNLHLRHTEKYRVDLADGRYVTGRFAHVETFTSTSHQPTITATYVARDRGTVYDAAGNPTGETFTLHSVEHFTYSETDGVDGPSAGDSFKASVAGEPRISCD